MADKEKLIEQFIINANAAAATCERISATPDALNQALVNATRNDDKVLFSRPDDLNPDLFSKFIYNDKIITTPTKEEMSNVRTGITDVFAGVASTGSICVPVTKNYSSHMSMLTRNHIAVLDSNSIVSRPSDLFSENHLEGKGLKRSFSFITGTSATADMGPLVRGVHGPGKLHIIILE